MPPRDSQNGSVSTSCVSHTHTLRITKASKKMNPRVGNTLWLSSFLSQTHPTPPQYNAIQCSVCSRVLHYLTNQSISNLSYVCQGTRRWLCNSGPFLFLQKQQKATTTYCQRNKDTETGKGHGKQTGRTLSRNLHNCDDLALSTGEVGWKRTSLHRAEAVL